MTTSLSKLVYDRTVRVPLKISLVKVVLKIRSNMEPFSGVFHPKR